MVNSYSRRSLLGISNDNKKKERVSEIGLALNYSNLSAGGLDKYTDSWNFETSAHLYRRATFGATGPQIKEAASKSMDEVMDQLFEQLPMPSEPINYNFENDPEVAIGESWVNKPVERSDQMAMILGYRRRSLGIWQLDVLLNSELNIREQMTLFWHNHFVTELQVVRDPNFTYNYITTLREKATGNFKTLTELMSIDPAMLRYLNGNQNRNGSPNENFARELMELFTIGKGDFAGEGDYTTFTETDVIETAKILTGWVDVGYTGRDGAQPGSAFVSNRHDRSSKQLSHRFGNVIVNNEGDQEYKTLINILFQQDEVSKFICRKLYRWFVYYDINEEVEKNVIEPLATLLRDNEFEILPALRTLLSSEHFYNICSVGPMIKHPIAFMTNLFKQNEVNLPENDLLRRYAVLFRIINAFTAEEMLYFNPPNVAGWKAYYQEPLFYRIWISSVTLRVRQNITDNIALGQIRIGDINITVDLLDYISKFDDPFDPNHLIDEFTANLLPQPISTEQKAFLKEILIPGLPDFEWTVEYGLYLGEPDNNQIRQSVDQKLRNFFSALLKMPEYYLS